jgi:hypothetical protein
MNLPQVTRTRQGGEARGDIRFARHRQKLLLLGGHQGACFIGEYAAARLFIVSKGVLSSRGTSFLN